MAGGIDTTDRKPRRLRGTPALKFSNRFAAVVLGIGVFTGLLLNQFPLLHYTRAKWGWDFMQVSEEENNRRQLISFLKQNRSSEIMQLLAEKENMEKDM